MEDYIDKDNTRYYILRIPYSIINELHTRDFEAIKQPIDESQVNETVEAVGFDFIRLPEVSCDYFKTEEEAIIRIKIFKSKAMVKGATQKENLETLSMVILIMTMMEKFLYLMLLFMLVKLKLIIGKFIFLSRILVIK